MGLKPYPSFMSDSPGQHFLNWADAVRAYSSIGLILSWRLFGSAFEPIFVFAIQTLYR